MLKLKVRSDNQDHVLEFEHSLLAVSKWESKHKKAFLGKIPPSPSEMMEYFGCMLLSPELDPDLIYALSPDQMETLTNYIGDTHTASTVPKSRNTGFNETPTSELIYYWMVAMKIDWEAQHWHLNRLMMLIQITNFKEQPEKNRNKAATIENWQNANERQKAMFKTKG